MTSYVYVLLGTSWYFPCFHGSLEGIRAMNDANSKNEGCLAKKELTDPSCKIGCRGAVPHELEAERICVVHFILAIESGCNQIRREAAAGLATVARRREIETYVKSTALKLSDVATSETRLTDELKKRVLTTLLTLMNLRECLDRSMNRAVSSRPPQRVHQPALALALRG